MFRSPFRVNPRAGNGGYASHSAYSIPMSGVTADQGLVRRDDPAPLPAAEDAVPEQPLATMQIADFHAGEELRPRIAAAEAAVARLTHAGRLAGGATGAITERQRRAVIYHSAHLQGNGLSRAQVDAVLDGAPPDEARPADVQEVVNLQLGLQYIEMLAAAEMPLTERLIRVLHAVVMRDLVPPSHEPGSYRIDDMDQLSYSVPAGVEVVPAMGTFGRWLTLKPESAEYEPSPILRAAYAHTRLLTIHPFHNGNGRVARLLMNLVLRRVGFPLAAIDGDARSAYLAALGAAGTDGDLTPTLILLLGAVEASLAAYDS
jgi:cell filamentation protein, protein adenylyltransferase